MWQNFSSIYGTKKFKIVNFSSIQHFLVAEELKITALKRKIDFMNFNVSQKNETRFVYVLPESNKRALVEYTLFSKTLLPEKNT